MSVPYQSRGTDKGNGKGSEGGKGKGNGKGRLAGPDLAALAVASGYLITEGARHALARDDRMFHATVDAIYERDIARTQRDAALTALDDARVGMRIRQRMCDEAQELRDEALDERYSAQAERDAAVKELEEVVGRCRLPRPQPPANEGGARRQFIARMQ